MNDKIERILKIAYEKDASDIFINQDNKSWLKIQNEIIPIDEDITTIEEIKKLFTDIYLDFEKLTDEDVGFIWDNHRYRINIFKNFGKISLVIRPIKSKIPEMSKLGLPNKLLENWFSEKNGLLLFTGSTGSGKSTSVASGVQWINNNFQKHIVTIEDPIEYNFINNKSLIHQRQVGSDTKSFQSGIRSALRQSPDVIFLGEIRDYETASTALQAAETGHLVISTLHSSNVTETIDRLNNIFPEERKNSLLNLLSNQLIGILSQKLIPASYDGYFLAVEHFRNIGATRNWIKNSQYTELRDFVNRTDNPNNCSFLNYLVAATKSGAISEENGKSASGNEQEFNRALKGIT